MVSILARNILILTIQSLLISYLSLKFTIFLYLSFYTALSSAEAPNSKHPGKKKWEQERWG